MSQFEHAAQVVIPSANEAVASAADTVARTARKATSAVLYLPSFLAVVVALTALSAAVGALALWAKVVALYTRCRARAVALYTAGRDRLAYQSRNVALDVADVACRYVHWSLAREGYTPPTPPAAPPVALPLTMVDDVTAPVTLPLYTVDVLEPVATVPDYATVETVAAEECVAVAACSPVLPTDEQIDRMVLEASPEAQEAAATDETDVTIAPAPVAPQGTPEALPTTVNALRALARQCHRDGGFTMSLASINVAKKTALEEAINAYRSR